MTAVPDVLVMAVGNVLSRDDGAGACALVELEATWDLPGRVRTVDAGTPGMEVGPLIDGADALVVLDAVDSWEMPGTVVLFRGRDIPAAVRSTPHEPALLEALLRLEFLGRSPRDVCLVGVVAGRLETGVGLTGAVQAAIPQMVRCVVAELLRLGIPAVHRPRPAAARRWWEGSAPPV